jgi:hypothetical protein
MYEMGAGGQSNTRMRGEGSMVRYMADEGNSCQVLEPNRNPRTLMVIIHKEAINQFPEMAYFGGVFSGGEVSVKAMDYILEYPYLVRATVDVVGHWRLRGFMQFSMVYLIIS